MRAFSWHPWIPGTLKLDSILFLFKCVVYQQAGHVPPLGQNHVVVVEQQAQGYFGSEPVVTTCNNFSCRQTVTTVVQENISQGGWLWCLLCSCFYSLIIGLLACCMDGFK